MGTLAFTTHLARGKSRDLQFLGRVNDSGAFDSVEILPFITVEEIGLESCAVVHVRVRTPATGISWQITSSIDAAVWSPADLVPLSSIDLGGGIVLRRFRMPFVIPEETMCSSFGERVFLFRPQAEPSSVRLRGGHSRSRERRDYCVRRGRTRD